MELGALDDRGFLRVAPRSFFALHDAPLSIAIVPVEPDGGFFRAVRRYQASHAG